MATSRNNDIKSNRFQKENMKNKQSLNRRIAIIITGFIIALIYFFSIKQTVHAFTDDVRVVKTLVRVETELLPSTPAGQYYEDLYFRNLQELTDIYDHDPYHSVAITYPRLILFIPGLEALVNGNGSTEKITSEQVNALQEEINWLLERCKPSLCKDINNEEERLPLPVFIGMTYQEAWDDININFQPNQ